MSDEQATTLERATDLGKDPKALARRWKLELKLADKREQGWRKKAKEVYGIYAPESAGANTFNILWTNTETLRQAVYNSQPQPDVRRRYQDEDPLGRAVGQVMTRALEFSADTYDENAVFQGDVLSMLLPGRAVSRVRYVPQISGGGEQQDAYEQIAWEQAILERVQWDDFRILSAAKTWDEVCAVAFRHRLTREDCVEKFGEKVGNAIPLDAVADEDVAKSDEKELFKTAEVWEIWDKDDKRVLWICKNYAEPCKVQADPMKLSGFFPIPRPLYAIENDSTLTPSSLYTQYEPQAKELNRISTRINKLIDALRVRGIYDATLTELGSLMKAADNELIASQGVTALIDRGGLEKAIWMMPIDTAAAVLKVLYEQREATKQVIYEITGISDIMRSATDPNETFGAQKIKTQWGTQRLQRLQQEVQRYVRDLIRLKAEVVAEKFQVETLERMTLVKLPHKAEVDAEKQKILAQYQQQVMQAVMNRQPQPPMPQLPDPITWEQVVQAMHDDATRTFRVDIETDSTLAATQDSDMSAMRDLLGGLAQMITGFGPAVQAGAIPIEAVKQIAMAVVRRAKMGSAVEDALDKMQQPQPGADPNAAKIAADKEIKQAEMQHQMQLEQMKAQAAAQVEREKMQAQMQLERDKAQMQAQVDQNRQQVEAQQQQAKMAAEAELSRFQAELDAQKEAQQLMHDRELAQMKIDADELKSQRDAQVKLQIAEMSKQTAMDTAALSAQTEKEKASLSASTEERKANISAEASVKTAKESKTPAPPDESLTKGLDELRSMVKEVHAKAHAPKTPTKIIRDKTRKATHYERDGQQYPIKYGPDGRIEEA